VRSGHESSIPSLENLELKQVRPSKRKGKSVSSPHNIPMMVECNLAQPKDFTTITSILSVQMCQNPYPQLLMDQWKAWLCSRELVIHTAA